VAGKNRVSSLRWRGGTSPPSGGRPPHQGKQTYLIKLGEIFTITRDDMGASSGYGAKLVRLKNLALVDISREVKPGWVGTAKLNFTFQAIKVDETGEAATVRFAVCRNWDLKNIVCEEELIFNMVESETGVGAIPVRGWKPFVVDIDSKMEKVFKEAVGEEFDKFTLLLVTVSPY
jgi:hypothetical protein